MVRSFDASPLDEVAVEALFEASLRAPTAGNTRGVGWVVLIGADEVARYFQAATDEAWRASAERAGGLERASAVGICLADPSAYVSRYAEDDKAASGLGIAPGSWPVPYWIGDAGAAVMAALLLAEESGLAAGFLGAFRRDAEVRAGFSVPPDVVIYGAVLLGRPDGADRRSRSLERSAPSRRALVRRGSWS
jgi:nitroreductase